MKVEYDKKVDALYIELKRGKAYKTKEAKDNFLVDLDKKGGVIGIEVLHYSKTVPVKERQTIRVGEKRVFIPA